MFRSPNCQPILPNLHGETQHFSKSKPETIGSDYTKSRLSSGRRSMFCFLLTINCWKLECQDCPIARRAGGRR